MITLASSVGTILFGRLYGFLDDMQKGVSEIIYLDFDALDVVPEINVYKMQQYQKNGG